MTHAERWSSKYRDNEARQPRVRFEDIEVFVHWQGDMVISSQSSSVKVPAARVPALCKFLHENFVRRDK